MVSRSPLSSLSRRGLLAACAAGLSATAGCTSLTGPRNVTADWPTRGRTPDRTSRATEREGPTPPLDVAWTAEFPSGGATCSPVVSDSTVYVGYVVERYDPDRGDLYVRAHDAASGAEQWRTRVATWDDPADARYSDAISVGDAVYVQTHEGLVALTGDGEVAWTFDNGGPTVRWGRIAHPAVGDDAVYAGTYGLTEEYVGDDEKRGDEAVVAVDPTDGTERWRFAVDEYGTDETLSPTLADGVVYATYLRSAVVALDAATGDLLWRRDVAASDPPTVRDGRAFVTAPVGESIEAHALFALDAATGETLWRRPTVDSWTTRGIAVDDQRVYYHGHTDEGQLRARDVATGEAVWHADGRDGRMDFPYGWGTPAVVGDRLYTTDSEYGGLHALDRATGEHLGAALGGREEGDGGSNCSPAVADGVAYHTAWGTLYAVVDCEASVGERCLV